MVCHAKPMLISASVFKSEVKQRSELKFFSTQKKID
jgi:hypothetical protein